MPERTCAICGETKLIEQFYKRNKPEFPSKEYSYWCRDCLKEKNRRHYWANRDKRSARAKVLREQNRVEHYAKKKAYYRKTREEVLRHYGGKCACCGEADIRFLAIDHVENDGAEHRKTVGTAAIIYWLRRNNYPKGFQALCHNCNVAKHIYGSCPHTL